MNRRFKTLVKHLLFGALICTGISACSDDTLENGANGSGQKESAPAYLTLAFSTNATQGSRSTSDTGINTGDNDGNAEDSGHHNVGTAAENKVHSVLVIACPEPDQPNGSGLGLAKLYTNSDNTSIPADGKDYKNFYVYKDKITSTSSDTEKPIELGQGKYNILVVVNPVNDIFSEYNNFTETSKLSEVQALYKKVLTGTYTPDEINVYRGFYLREYEANNANSGHTSEDTGFMMANREATPVTLTSDNTPNKPAHVVVNVERNLSKITYRKIKDGNKYPVTIETKATAALKEGYIVTLENDKMSIADEKTKFNVALDAAKQTVYVTYKTGENGAVLDQVYYFYGNEYDKSDNVTTSNRELYAKATCKSLSEKQNNETGYYYVEDIQNPEASLELQHDVVASEIYIVTIQGYALVNLSKSVQYVRHTVYGSTSLGDPFGMLNGNNFLWTPYWADKNALKFTDDNELADGSSIGTNWFYNTLKEVSDESKTLSIANGVLTDEDGVQYYHPMSTMTPEADNATVSGTVHPGYESNPNIGATMGYCLENSTDIEHQVHGLSTGISFVATVSDKDGNELEHLYRYGGHTYISLAAIQKAYGVSRLGEAFQTLVNKEKNEENITKEELAAVNVVEYNDNTCYYYTNEIKHFDNLDDTEMGNMEFAIMRNNIYSIAIQNINAIGDPFVDPTPGVKDETDKTALDIEVRIVPWIVRYNNLDF